LADKLEELVLLSSFHLSTPLEPTPQPTITDDVAEKAANLIPPTDAEVDTFINAARNSPDPRLAFLRLLDTTNWTRRGWADAASCSESSISRWIQNRPVRRCEKWIWNALRGRLREFWPDVRGITFENL
jgi:hypothetical protein